MQIFLAAPFTQMLTDRGGFDSEFKDRLSDVHAFLESLGHQVFSAHTRERWGQALDSPSGALEVDLAAIDNCDALIAVIGVPPSPGVQLELGYAIARGKPILIIVDPESPPPYLVAGIPSVARAVISVTADLAETKLSIKEALETLRPRSSGASARA